jgi:hypothetical protein
MVYLPFRNEIELFTLKITHEYRSLLRFLETTQIASEGSYDDLMNENRIYMGHAVSWIRLLKRNYLHPSGVFFVWSSSVQIFSISSSLFYIPVYSVWKFFNYYFYLKS